MNRKWIAFVIMAGFLIAGAAAVTEGLKTDATHPSIRTSTYMPKAVYTSTAGMAFVDAGLKERVTCNFIGSGEKQTCSTDRADCSGMTGCTATVTGKNGETLVWKSSCGGYASTTLDGTDETVKFDCPQIAKETIKCNFVGGDHGKENTCSSPAGSCSGVGTCIVNAEASKDTEITWKSTCGKPAISIQDGIKQTLNFDCGMASVTAAVIAEVPKVKEETSTPEVAPTPVVAPLYKPQQPSYEKKYAKATWTCYGSDSLSFAVTSKVDHTELEWHAIADQSCQGHCTDTTCGVGKFTLGTRRVYSTV
jgi:hypothetical protein